MPVDVEIATAAAAVVTGLALPDVDVRVLKRPVAPEGEAPPVAYVSVAEERFEPATADDDKSWFGYYRLTVTLAARSPLLLRDGTAERDWRQRVRRAVTQPALYAAGATAVDDVDPVGRPAFDLGALDRGWAWAPVSFTVRTLEPR